MSDSNLVDVDVILFVQGVRLVHENHQLIEELPFY